MSLSLAHLRLIDALAEAIARDYLRDEALRHKGSDQQQPNHPPLPPAERAA